MFKLADRVKETSVTSGSGNFVQLSGPFGSFQSFNQGIGDGNSTYYTIENNINFEVGIGTYSSLNNSLSRDIILQSSNNDQKINLAGVSIVFCSYPADKAVFLNNNGYISGLSGSYAGIIFPDSTVQITAANSSRKTYTTISSNSNVQVNNDYIFADCSSNSIQLTMPNASGNNGLPIFIKKIGSNTLTIIPSGSQLIDGQSSFNIHHEYQSISLFSNNIGWYIF